MSLSGIISEMTGKLRVSLIVKMIANEFWVFFTTWYMEVLYFLRINNEELRVHITAS